MQELPRYSATYMETWWSGLTYLFAKEAGLLKGLEGSNPSVSAVSEIACGFANKETSKASARFV